MAQSIVEIEQPSDSDSLWRYMDLGKYISLLKSQSLFLCPQTALDDPFEGSSPEHLSFESILTEQLNRGDFDEVSADSFRRLAGLARPVLLGRTFVSCWHLSEYESHAMWKIYSSSIESICIKTTCAKLKAQLPENANFGKVRYIDFSTFDRPERSLSYHPAFFKRQSFEHEKEVRIVVTDIPSFQSKEAAIKELVAPNKAGKLIPIALASLVDSVYVNPLAPAWFVDVARDVTAKYAFEFDVTQSQLAQSPAY